MNFSQVPGAAWLTGPIDDETSLLFFFFEYEFSFTICCSSKKYVTASSKTDPSFPPLRKEAIAQTCPPHFFLEPFKVPAISHTPHDQIIWIMHSTMITMCFQNQKWMGSARKIVEWNGRHISPSGEIDTQHLECAVWGTCFLFFCVRWSETALGPGFRGFVRLLKNVPVHFSSCSLLTAH